MHQAGSSFYSALLWLLPDPLARLSLGSRSALARLSLGTGHPPARHWPPSRPTALPGSLERSTSLRPFFLGTLPGILTATLLATLLALSSLGTSSASQLHTSSPPRLLSFLQTPAPQVPQVVSRVPVRELDPLLQRHLGSSVNLRKRALKI